MNKIIIVGSGVSGICAATKLINLGIKGQNIEIIDKGLDPYLRSETELMLGFAGAGLRSDGKLTRHTSVGGQLSKYCGEDKAYELMDEAIAMIESFHPDPSQIMMSDPQTEPDFIKPYFELRLFPVKHIGTDKLFILGQIWYDWLISKGVQFEWECNVLDIDFLKKRVTCQHNDNKWKKFKEFDKLIYCTGKSGIDLTQKLIKQYNLKTEPKSVQIGVRFESEQKYFQKLIDISYDFKLYQKPNDKVSIRSFCTNNNAAYVAIEKTYGDISYNGHASKDEALYNGKTNFGIIMEIKGIENPFEWARNVVQHLQGKKWLSKGANIYNQVGLYYSPDPEKEPSNTAEGEQIEWNYSSLDNLDKFKEVLGEYAEHILLFIEDLKKVFPIENDWGIYFPEVKYLSEEVLVNYKNLSLIDYPDIYFAGDSLSSRGISISASQGIMCANAIFEDFEIFISKSTDELSKNLQPNN
jgi:uncharacterized FAD-dependent dehydrogenase